jgi:hypothetical protein
MLSQQARRVAYHSSASQQNDQGHKVQRLSRAATLSSFIDALERDGCVIVTDFTDKATLEQADQEIRPWLEEENTGAVVGGESSTLITYQIGRSKWENTLRLCEPNHFNIRL